MILTTGFAPSDIETMLPAHVRRADRWALGEFEAAKAELERVAPQLWTFTVGGRTIDPQGIHVELLTGDSVSFEIRFALGATAGQGRLEARQLLKLPSGHRQFVVISDARGSTLAKQLLSAKNYAVEFPLGEVGAAPRGIDAGPCPESARGSGETTTFIGFLRLGLEHIWTGYDHLLFLLALLIVCRSYRSTLGVVTFFTLAHSLTLALATLDLVSIPPRFVEAAIAGSIVFVAAENLLRRGQEPRGRWALTFGFGLIHGFGFASVLRDLGVGGGNQAVALPLFSFNLGVELGQIAVAAVALPLLLLLRRRDGFVAKGVPIISGVVFVAGLVWLVQRTIFP